MEKQTPVEYLLSMISKTNYQDMKELIEKAKSMERDRDKRIALHFIVLGIKTKGDFSKIDFYKEIDNL